MITGASSGLGREMAVQLARRGFRLALTARRADLLAETARAVEAAGGEALTLVGEVSDPESVRAHHAAIVARWGGLDWAILNAGIGISLDARRFEAANVARTLAVNVLGVAYWLEAVLPAMIRDGRGTVAAVSSLAAFRGMPGRGSYAASKAALNALLEAARVDLRGTGVRVVTVCPGFVKSELTARNDPKDMLMLLETEDGARRVLAAVERGESLAHFPWPVSSLVVHGLARLPNWLYDPLAARFLRRDKKPYREP